MKLKVKDISKNYNRYSALRGVNLELEPGLYGLLGPNGAGKSTLLKIIAGILRPTAGSILLDNEPVSKLGEHYRAMLGYMPQDLGIYPEFTAKRYLLYIAALKGLTEAQAKAEIDKLLEAVGLSSNAEQKLKGFSGGMLRRVGIAQTLLCNPQILLLDEPTAGLDPQERVRLRNLLSALAQHSINAKPSEIFFTSGGTESDNWAIKGCAFADESKRATITSTIEHHAVLRSCQFIEKLGYPVAYINPNSNGLITVEMLERVIAGTTNLVSVATANNEIGTIQPINKLAEIAHRNGAFFHTDAVQAMGHIPVDVNELNVDLLSASAHKFNGPKGIGFLYVREGTPILPLLNGGAQENSLRAGTENVASIVGMATALSMSCSQMQKSQNQSAKMVELICSILNDAEVDYIRNGYSNGLKGTLNLSFRDKNGEAILHRLDLRGILVSTGSACDSNSTQVSHVIRAINVPDSYAKGTIRISLGKDNTLEEAKIIGETLVSVLMEQK